MYSNLETVESLHAYASRLQHGTRDGAMLLPRRSGVRALLRKIRRSS